MRTLFVMFMALVAFQFTGTAQEKNFFDKQGKACDEANAYYYRTEEADSRFVSKYVYGDALYFEGKIIDASYQDENKNVYAGECIWYYKNGRKKLVRNYSDTGVLNGMSTHFFDSGNIQREEVYENGFLKDGVCSEYDESGAYSKVFRDDFTDNRFDWDVYTDTESISKVEGGSLYIKSLTASGSARMISIPQEFLTFSVEALIDLGKQSASRKAGIIFGFKDWDNYWYFMVSREKYYIGYVFEGLSNVFADGYFISGASISNQHALKVITGDDKWFFSVDGVIQRSVKDGIVRGRQVGFVVGGKDTYGNFDNLVVKEFFDGSGKDNSAENSNSNVKSTGTGVILSTNGYIVTNHHVVDGKGEIYVDVTGENGTQTYKATVVQMDKQNDLAIIKIDDPKFTSAPAIQYGIKTTGAVESGASVFTIGFPLALSGMGVEPKFSDGRISAKTGYDGAINSFQTTIPVQPGNSGGPVFNAKGELIGIVNATIFGSDNVSYAIKASYVMGLIESLNETVAISETSSVSTLTVEEQVKKLRASVVLIKIK